MTEAERLAALKQAELDVRKAQENFRKNSSSQNEFSVLAELTSEDVAQLAAAIEKEHSAEEAPLPADRSPATRARLLAKAVAKNKKWLKMAKAKVEAREARERAERCGTIGAGDPGADADVSEESWSTSEDGASVELDGKSEEAGMMSSEAPGGGRRVETRQGEGSHRSTSSSTAAPVVRGTPAAPATVPPKNEEQQGVSSSSRSAVRTIRCKLQTDENRVPSVVVLSRTDHHARAPRPGENEQFRPPSRTNSEKTHHNSSHGAIVSKRSRTAPPALAPPPPSLPPFSSGLLKEFAEDFGFAGHQQLPQDEYEDFEARQAEIEARSAAASMAQDDYEIRYDESAGGFDDSRDVLCYFSEESSDNCDIVGEEEEQLIEWRQVSIRLVSTASPARAIWFFSRTHSAAPPTPHARATPSLPRARIAILPQQRAAARRQCFGQKVTPEAMGRLWGRILWGAMGMGGHGDGRIWGWEDTGMGGHGGGRIWGWEDMRMVSTNCSFTIWVSVKRKTCEEEDGNYVVPRTSPSRPRRLLR